MKDMNDKLDIFPHIKQLSELPLQVQINLPVHANITSYDGCYITLLEWAIDHNIVDVLNRGYEINYNDDNFEIFAETSEEAEEILHELVGQDEQTTFVHFKYYYMFNLDR